MPLVDAGGAERRPAARAPERREQPPGELHRARPVPARARRSVAARPSVAQRKSRQAGFGASDPAAHLYHLGLGLEGPVPLCNRTTLLLRAVRHVRRRWLEGLDSAAELVRPSKRI